MLKAKTKFKKGAASFYIVAFSTLILVVIAASFTTVILSEMAMSENDELSQSAYDAALAGLEDAKVAFANYQKCKQGGVSSGAVSCAQIDAMIKNPDCGMVAKILGRNSTGEEVLVEEKSNYSGGVSNNMQQAYTCVKIGATLSNYTSTLTEEDTTRVVRVKLANGVRARQIQRVKISWYSTKEYSSVAGSNYNFPIIPNENKLAFPPFRTTSIALPPMLSVGLVQTADVFALNDFAIVSGNRTNRGTVFLVPTKDYAYASKTQTDAYNNDLSVNYIGTCNGRTESVCRENGGLISVPQVVKTNDQTAKNFPFAVLCSNGRNAGGDFACSTWLELPQPIGGDRSDETFMFVVTLPYGQPSTSFSLEFYCADGTVCSGAGGAAGSGSNKAEISGTQIEIDSTGRANNLYRRILTRMEPADTSFPFPLYAIELLKPNPTPSESLLIKPGIVTSEYNFY